ncbi:acetoacetate--CoA ligase [Thermoflavimicrobium dichotomicum]|uniref:Acetoacetyl-CoA synthetase n=1 Tax=Thermoflavimicrobium dichotomicum TaxID=46223 RepID=A0A1I3JGI6_9BACL|nr:acetoacetate--CoA ligase [Thermoflavimicrobium dichotomicum]SFI59266.1 acetoacetyl-CoA synthetase [Thermoflavimicrobium dichotomicum]
MERKIKEGAVIWEPPYDFQHNSNIFRYISWLKYKKGLSFRDYHQLWKWSVNDITGFWETIWEYFDIIASKPYKAVLENPVMPGAKWFPGAELNYAEHIFHNRDLKKTALIHASELRPLAHMTWRELYDQVAAMRLALKTLGVTRGDRVVGYLPNIPETIVSFLACASIGAIWSSCSPDFGSLSVIDRFKQIEPKVLIATDGYRYGGKDFVRTDVIKEIQQAIPTLRKTVIVPYLSNHPNTSQLANVDRWDELIAANRGQALTFEQVPFSHPLWILYSSGTTGIPKAIVQGHGGILLEHLKMETFHMDLKPNDRFFWFTTTGWMMWNVVVSGLLTGATAILFDGNPGYPDLNTLWKLAEETQMTVFGTSASFIKACMDAEIHPGRNFDLSHLKSIGSTGSPLSPEGFQWVYDHVKEDLWLVSTSGGTDLCSAFVGGCPLLPVRAGEIQCRALGAAVEAFDDKGKSVTDTVGELVVRKPMPSMPLFLWNDIHGSRYQESYFDMYPGVWRHGDWIKITRDGGCVIYGRSDSTINRGGVRIGTSEIYRAVESIPDIVDSLVIDVQRKKSESEMLLFVVLKNGKTLDEERKKEIKQRIRSNCSPRHIPNDIYEVPDIPRTLNGKKLEVPVKKILQGEPLETVVNKGALSNPDSLQFFVKLQEKYTKGA